jgi:hypothetical protein
MDSEGVIGLKGYPLSPPDPEPRKNPFDGREPIGKDERVFPHHK